MPTEPTDHSHATSQETDADFDAAVADPSAFFESPAAIVADTEMTDEQKQRFLAAWEQDITARQRAAEEGMVPEAGSGADNDAAQLKRVKAAIGQLDATPSAATTPGRSHWKRWGRDTLA